jgi:hypothetical protein
MRFNLNFISTTSTWSRTGLVIFFYNNFSNSYYSDCQTVHSEASIRVFIIFKSQLVAPINIILPVFRLYHDSETSCFHWSKILQLLSLQANNVVLCDLAFIFFFLFEDINSYSFRA